MIATRTVRPLMVVPQQYRKPYPRSEKTPNAALYPEEQYARIRELSMKVEAITTFWIDTSVFLAIVLIGVLAIWFVG